MAFGRYASNQSPVICGILRIAEPRTQIGGYTTFARFGVTVGAEVGQHNQQFYLYRDGEQYGPYGKGLFNQLVADNRIKPDDWYWTDGLEAWAPVSSLQFQDTKPPLRPHTASAIIAVIASEPYRLVRVLYSLLTNPSTFAIENIGQGTASTQRAVSFWLGLFSIVFLLWSARSFLQFYDGPSEWRETLRLFTQLVFGIFLIYVLCKCLFLPASLRGVAEAVLYADIAYLFLSQIFFYIPFKIYGYHTSYALGDVDLVSTYIAQCFSENNILYWLMNGENQYYLNSSGSDLVASLRSAPVFVEAAVALPFCFLFGRLLSARFGGHQIAYASVGLIGFVASIYGWHLLSSLVDEHSWKSTHCEQQVRQKLQAKYSTTARVEQAVFKLGAYAREQMRQDDLKFLAKRTAAGATIQIQGPIDDPKGLIDYLSKELYCPGIGPFWEPNILAVPVTIISYNSRGEPYSEQLAEHKCSVEGQD